MLFTNFSTASLAQIKNMKPTDAWINDWSYGVDPCIEKSTAEDLLRLFSEFWCWAELSQKSKKTRRRYSSALHALGGYLVVEAGEGNKSKKSTYEFVQEKVNEGGGPLVYLDNEEWQNELDLICRKLCRYFEKNDQEKL